MAVKKTELYSSLWASCDALRGGMDASQYKDYILTLLFMKYVTDKYKGQKYGDLTVFDKANDPNPDPEKRTGCSFDDFIALKNKKNIGEGIDKIIARLAEVNEGLKGVIDIAHFNDEAKIGKDKEMVDKLTKLIAIFQSPELDFSKNKAEGDDIIGDAYEYLMRNFASESGKSKGQFYTPAEVSRILAKIIGIDKCTDHDATVCDPACGSGSLLIRALAEAPFEISGYGQEKDGWGTCNTEKKKLWFNLQLAQKPIECLEYVILHELIHLRERTHNSTFIAYMDMYMKNWRAVRKELNDSRLDYYDAQDESPLQKLIDQRRYDEIKDAVLDYMTEKVKGW